MRPHLEPGLWVVLATPFDEDLAVDLGSLERQLALAEESEADGVVALGVFGEAESLSLREQRAVAATVSRSTALPFVLGLPARTTAAAIEQADVCSEAADREPRALMLQAHSPRADVLAAHLRAVTDATDRPLVLQDYPAASGVTVPLEALLSAARDSVGFLAAVKAEAPPTPPAIATLTDALDVPVFGGLGGVGLVDELGCGAAGAMTGMSHPEALRATIDARRRSGLAAAQETWAPWLPLATFEGQLRIGLAIRKEILHRRGVLNTGRVRPPAAGLPPSLLPLIDHHLSHLPRRRTLREEPAWT